MARLNGEPPASAISAAQPGTESVDACKSSSSPGRPVITSGAMRTETRVATQAASTDLIEVKRRFIRQNRELAKNNSHQSLRIRNLELEVSRLLADNLDLREKVLLLENELDHARGQISSDGLRTAKEALQAKLSELSGLLDGLDAAALGSGDAAPRPRETKPLEGQWRERQPLTEVMRDSALPTITENKLYPRRTLGADEIQAIRLSDHRSNESPDLGPPPVAHFDYEDPTKPHVSPSAGRTAPVEEGALAGLGVNLETRRRRKDGQPKIEIRRRSILPSSPDKKDGEGSTMLRTGAKRKLADRDLDKPVRPLAKDEFTFSRRTTPNEPGAAEPPVALQEQREEQATSSPKPVRKALSDKSANLSPRKVSVRPGKANKDGPQKPDKPASTKSSNGTARPQARSRRVSSIPLPSPPRNEVLATVEIAPPAPPPAAEPAPETPAAHDLFSPTPSEPSAKPTDSRAGTPPPGDLRTLSAAADGGARPSRRARSAVNYAEPSLVAKMRRPSKQMVDAISGLQDPRHVMSDRKSISASKSTTVKREPGDDEASWRSLPAADTAMPESPLGPKGSQVSHSDAMGALAEDEPDAASRVEPSAASATISALMAGSRKRRAPGHGPQPLGTDVDAAAQKMEDLDIDDVDDSSPPASDNIKGNDTTARRATRTKPSAASHRRHSSAPKNLADASGASGADGSNGERPPSGGALPGAGASERAVGRRRSMML